VIRYASLNVKVHQSEADHAYYEALTDRRFPSCYVTSQEMFQLPILQLSCNERTHKIAVTREACMQLLYSTRGTNEFISIYAL
jgi:hypothetical protein